VPNRERRKGLEGEREVRALWESHGFTVRGLEGAGDHVIVRHEPRPALPLTALIHSEVKRQEVSRPLLWMGQASREAPPGAVPVVSWRPSHTPWIAFLWLDDLAKLLA
jgi:hypothetical protein